MRQKALDQQRNIFLAFAQRRQRQPDDVEAMKQILAKTPRRDFLLQIPVGRGHDANVDFDPLQRSEGPEFLFLKHAEQLDLEFEREFADFVEKGGAAIGEFDQPALGCRQRR